MNRDSLNLEVPEPDYEGFVNWARNEYHDDRCSSVAMEKDSLSGGYVSIHSGEHPSFSRFLKDVRPKLHEYGFVISRAREAEIVPSEGSEVKRRHHIKGIPMIKAVLHANGYICDRLVCRNVTEEEYCKECRPFME